MSLKDEIKELEEKIEELKEFSKEKNIRISMKMNWIHGKEYKFPEILKDLIRLII